MKDRLPEIARKGVELEKPNPQPEIRKLAETNKGWDYSQEAAILYRRADVIIDRFYPAIHTPHFQGRLPSVLIAVDSLRNKNILAAYRLVPDEYGLNFKITMNKQHYVDGKDDEGKKAKVWRYGAWAQMETLVHEIGHHWQQMLGENPYKQGARVTHNKEFCHKMERLGIHCASEGYHTQLAGHDSPFGRLMKEWGIQPPADMPKNAEYDMHWFREFFKDRERSGQSTLHKWVCPTCGINVRYTRKDDPQLIHAPCNAVLIKPDAVDQPIYPVPAEE
jgi:hypothetical protein